MARVKGLKEHLLAELLSIENEIEGLTEMKQQPNSPRYKKTAIDARLKFIRRRKTALNAELRNRRHASESAAESRSLDDPNFDPTPHFDSSGSLRNNVFKLHMSQHPIPTSKISDQTEKATVDEDTLSAYDPSTHNAIRKHMITKLNKNARNSSEIIP
jgi:hypothetical protein